MRRHVRWEIRGVAVSREPLLFNGSIENPHLTFQYLFLYFHIYMKVRIRLWKFMFIFFRKDKCFRIYNISDSKRFRYFCPKDNRNDNPRNDQVRIQMRSQSPNAMLKCSHQNGLYKNGQRLTQTSDWLKKDMQLTQRHEVKRIINVLRCTVKMTFQIWVNKAELPIPRNDSFGILYIEG